MKKRVICVFLMVLAVFASVEIRTYGIANGKVRASYTPSSKSIEIASLKGTIYDCKLRALTNCEYEYTAVAKPTPEAHAAARFNAVRGAFFGGKGAHGEGQPRGIQG